MKRKIKMAYLRLDFEKWLKTTKQNNGQNYSQGAITNYMGVIKNYCKKLDGLSINNTDLFFVDNVDEFSKIHAIILAHPKFNDVNMAYHRAFSSGLIAYKKFLEERESMGASYVANITFEYWMNNCSGRDYRPSTVSRYCKALELIEDRMGLKFDKPILEIRDEKEFEEVAQIIQSASNYEFVNKKYGNGDLHAAILAYTKYLKYLKQDNGSWWPSKEEFDPKLSKEDWKKFIIEVEKPKYPACVRMLKGMMELGGETTCKELSIKYGGHTSVYAACAMNIGRHVKSYYNLSACMDGEQERYFPFPFLGKRSGGGEDNYIYKIRPELYDALNEIDLSDVSPYYESEHKTGQFDSWEIVDDVTAIKTCDKSFFAYNGSGVPKEICWFFNAEDIPTGENKPVKLVFEGKEFIGKLTNDTTDRRRIQIRWNSDLTKNLEMYKVDDAKAKFVKVENGVYELIMSISESIFNEELFNKALVFYKEAVKQGRLKNELYKWEAIKSFQDNWDINEPNFVDMWEKSTNDADNLLGSKNTYPRKMIAEFAEQEPETVRSMFLDLYDEAIDLEKRINNFKEKSDELIKKYGTEKKKQHFQSLNSISVYLWLRYPDKYYIYKFGELENANKIGFVLSKEDKIGSAYKMYNRIAAIFGEDNEIEALRQEFLNEKCYPDKLFRTFAMDFIYYVSRKYVVENNEGGEPEMTIKEKVENIKSYIAAKGFNYEGELIENFYLSLKSKPFVILAGTSGTGKTKLVKLFAEAIGAEMKLVPVRPDWSDSSDLFGHVDLVGNFKAGAIIDFVKQAELDKDKPYFLCLDEMNLARVEYYLSDFLSIIETRDRVNGEIITDPLVSEEYYQNETAKEKYGKLIIPENLYIIGTVNMDETTFPFSKKVLDRANTIEFSFVNFMPKEQPVSTVSALQLDNSFLKTKYLYLSDIDNEEFVNNICFKLEELNEALRKANLHVGYRVRDEISFYMMNNQECELLEENAAFDNEIMQKILPRIQGSSGAIKQLLCDLFKICIGEYIDYTNSNPLHEQMASYLEDKKLIYPNTAKKIVFMMRRYEEDGFTSYWL